MLNRLGQWKSRSRAAISGMWNNDQSPAESGQDRSWWRFGLILLGIYLLIIIVLSFYWSSEPALIDVNARVSAVLTVNSGDAVDSDSSQELGNTTGAQTTVALIEVARALLDKRGGYLSNDILPPGLWLDNIPSWEYGVLIQVRDLTRVMRESYSRSQSQSKEDGSLKKAEAQFNFNNTSWILPATEDEYRSGIAALEDYLGRLSVEEQQDAQFYARSDNLRYWLGTVETRLGSLSQNLSASVGQKRLNTDLAGDSAARQSTSRPEELMVRTSWFEIDDVFYEARGSTWALIHFLRAAEVDFAEVLQRKNARISMQQIIRELEGSQQSLFSPVILNGSGFGMLANHSLVMANYISRANAAIIDLRELLARG